MRPCRTNSPDRLRGHHVKGPNNSTIVLFQSLLYSNHPCNVGILHGNPLISIRDLPMMHSRRNEIIIDSLLAQIIILGEIQSHVFGSVLIVILRFNLIVQSRKHRNSELGLNNLAWIKVHDDDDIQIPITRCTSWSKLTSFLLLCEKVAKKIILDSETFA